MHQLKLFELIFIWLALLQAWLAMHQLWLATTELWLAILLFVTQLFTLTNFAPTLASNH